MEVHEDQLKWKREEDEFFLVDVRPSRSDVSSKKNTFQQQHQQPYENSRQ